MTKSIETLLEIIKKLCGEQGFTLETNKFFAYELNVSERTVSRMIKKLTEGRQISVKQVDNRRMLTIVNEDKRKCIDNNIEEEMKNLKNVPVWQIDTIVEFLNGIETDLNPVLITRFIRIFGFKSVINSLEEFLEIKNGSVLKRDFKKFLDAKYLNAPSAKEIRKMVQVEFS